MIGHGVSRRYARALFEIGQEQGALEDIERELAAVDATIAGEKEAREALFHPLIPVEEKVQLVERLFKGRVGTVTLNFLKLLVEKKRERYLSSILAEYRDLVAKAKRILQVEAVFAREPKPAVVAGIKERLTAVTGSQIDLRVAVEPRLIGGVVLRVGDKRLDGSIRTRLEVLRQRIREARMSEKR